MTTYLHYIAVKQVYVMTWLGSLCLVLFDIVLHLSQARIFGLGSVVSAGQLSRVTEEADKNSEQSAA